MADVTTESRANLNLNEMFYGCSALDAPNMNFQTVSKNVERMDRMFYGAGAEGTTTFDGQEVRFKKLLSCDDAFKNAKFGFRGTTFQFFGRKVGTEWVSSIASWFSGNRWLAEDAPRVLMSTNGTSSISEMYESLSEVDGATGAFWPPAASVCGGGIGYMVYSTSDSDSTEDSGNTDGIYDFSNLYSNTSIRRADIRGISYCLPGSLNDGIDYTSMFEGCGRLEEVKGPVPSHGHSYERMFNGCSSLELDLSESFVRYDDTTSAFTSAYNGSYALTSYSPTSIAYMFNGVKALKSTRDEFDLVSLVRTTAETLEGKEVKPSRHHFDHAFPVVAIAMDAPVKELSKVAYDIKSVSSKLGIVRYCSDKAKTTVNSTYGLGSDFMTWVFPNGFLRYGGVLRGSRNQFILVPYYPVRNAAGETVGFKLHSSARESRLSPPTSYSPFNVTAHYKNHDDWVAGATNPWNVFTASMKECPNHRAWNEVTRSSTLYSALVYNADGSFVGKRYLGICSETIHSNGYHEACKGLYNVTATRGDDLTVFNGAVTVEIPDVGCAFRKDGTIDASGALDESWYASLLA